jgi:hypothetical protein
MEKLKKHPINERAHRTQNKCKKRQINPGLVY